MSGWRQETASDLRDATDRIERLLAEVSGRLSPEQLGSVWNAYVMVEKSVAFIKIDMDEENPGKLVNKRLFRVPDERQALRFALRKIKAGSEEFTLGDFRRALKELRDGRNYLRMLLRDARRAKTKRSLAAERT